MDVINFNDATRLGRIARRAVDTVYRDLPYRKNWRYYQRRQTLQTVASYSTGTIEYDHTGGSSERLVTLTTGTFPSWTKFGKIVIEDVTYRIATNPSSSTITLYEEDNPGADVAAGTTYTLYRSEYPTPIDFRRNIRLYDLTDQEEIPIIGVGEAHALAVGVDNTPDTPRRAYLRNVADHYGVWSIEFLPPPSAIRSYDLSYEAKPRDIGSLGASGAITYATGTVSTSGTTVTGSGTTFPTYCAGAVIRFGTSASGTAVTNKFGANPFTEQRIVASRDSATQLTLDAAPTSAYSAGTAFSISDLIDIHPGGMTTAFLRMIEAECAKMLNMKDYPEREAVALRALDRAMENEPSDEYANAAPAMPARVSWTTEE